MIEWKLRKSRPADTLTIYDLIRNAFAGILGPHKWIKSLEQTAAKSSYLSAPVEIIVASIPCTSGKNCYDGERVIGFYMFGPYVAYEQPHFPKGVPKENAAFNLYCIIDHDFKRRGIEEALVIAGLTETRKMKYLRMYSIELSTDKEHLRILKKQGFKTVVKFNDPSHPKLELVLSVIEF